MSVGAQLVTAEHLRQFDSLGYFVLERVIDPPSLGLLQTIADEAEAARSAERLSGSNKPAIGDAEGPQLMDTHGGRTFAFGVEKERPEMYSAILGDWAVAALAALTPSSSLFHTEFVIKAGGRTDRQTRFGWHQDGGYTTAPDGGEPSPPHISVWCALDDMTAGAPPFTCPNAHEAVRGSVWLAVRHSMMLVAQKTGRCGSCLSRTTQLTTRMA
jgi:ectoine hydroxylase-related dioxygenase (phytanoyl-CoA dioxygenase family)